MECKHKGKNHTKTPTEEGRKKWGTNKREMGWERGAG